MKMLSGDRNQCQGCKAYFNSVKAFDKHRTGKHGVDRRCLTEDEMLGKGMSVNKDGFWITKAMPVALVQQREKSKE
jgi:hypothetical protein